MIYNQLDGDTPCCPRPAFRSALLGRRLSDHANPWVSASTVYGYYTCWNGGRYETQARGTCPAVGRSKRPKADCTHSCVRHNGTPKLMPTALVLSAGGMFAAWEIGVWTAPFGRISRRILLWVHQLRLSPGTDEGHSQAARIPKNSPTTGSIRLRLKLMQLGLHRAGFLRPDALHAKARELFEGAINRAFLSA